MKFSEYFKALWGYPPFPWQEMLAKRLVEGTWPTALDLPTAAGKTACIDAAVFALAVQSEQSPAERTAPRRIWFVVDRRIVVDEAFDRAATIGEELHKATDGILKEVADRLRSLSGLGKIARPLAAAKLRGGIMRDDTWARVPSQPAVITSTVDQIGSNLLFRSYSHGQLAAPIFAGLAANDSVILLDEAHCSRPFLQTVSSISEFRSSKWSEVPVENPFFFTALSATLNAQTESDDIFPTPEEREVALDHKILKQRIGAEKWVDLPNAVDQPASWKGKYERFVSVAGDEALKFIVKEKARIAVIVNRVAVAQQIAEYLADELVRDDAEDPAASVVLLTGRLRPCDRDELLKHWKQYLRANDPKPHSKPIIFVSTQCIEVGADLSFDVMISECASLDALRQRFGRLDRLGELSNNATGTILIRDADTKASSPDDPVYGGASRETWNFLRKSAMVSGKGSKKIYRIDFGIAGMDNLMMEAAEDYSGLQAPREDAPKLLPSHLDLLSQTSEIPHPEPDVSMFLHGPDRSSPEVRVLWRADLHAGNKKEWPEIVSLCPPVSGETLSVPLFRLKRWLSEEGSTDTGADTLGASGTDSKAVRGRPFLRWRGRSDAKVIESLGEIGPGETIVLPGEYGIGGLGQLRIDSPTGGDAPEQRVDLWENAIKASGRPASLRIHPKLRSPRKFVTETAQKLCEEVFSGRMDLSSIRDLVDELRTEAIRDAEIVRTSPLHQFIANNHLAKIDFYAEKGILLQAKCNTSQSPTEEDYFSDSDELTSWSTKAVPLDSHTVNVLAATKELVPRCLSNSFADVFLFAAEHHDTGKLDPRFQNMLWNGDDVSAHSNPPLAKSEKLPLSQRQRNTIRKASGLPLGFRHEALSCVFASESQNGLNGKQLDLALHLIATHHGYGRPFMPISVDTDPPTILPIFEGRFEGLRLDPEKRAAVPPAHRIDSGHVQRFWRSTRRHGWWGLAYLEAVFRLSDWYASELERKDMEESS